MADKIFKLANNAPARASFKGRGVIILDSISNELALELVKEGCPYIELTAEGKSLLKTEKKPIVVTRTTKQNPKKSVKTK